MYILVVLFHFPSWFSFVVSRYTDYSPNSTTCFCFFGSSEELRSIGGIIEKAKGENPKKLSSLLTYCYHYLLAREGINAEQLAQDLKSFELKMTFEDVFPAEATIVEEYLQ
ncbi:hypothetical protein ACSBR1_036474 [Camellia fascicularis]